MANKTVDKVTKENKTVDKVTIKLYKGKSSSEQQDVIAGVNGCLFQIRRGVPVEVPTYIAKMLEDSEKEISESLEYINELSNVTEI